MLGRDQVTPLRDTVRISSIDGVMPPRHHTQLIRRVGTATKPLPVIVFHGNDARKLTPHAQLVFMIC